MKYRMNEDLAPETLSNDIKALIELSRIINKPFKELTPDDIYAFLSCLSSKSKGTVGLYKLKIKAFFKFIGREDIAQLCVVKHSMRDRKLPDDLLTPEDIELLIKSTNNLRDKAYIAVLYESGARVCELEELQLKHVFFDDNGAVITLPKGKTGARRIRVVYAAGYLRNWVEIHPSTEDRGSWLWTSSRDGKVHVDYKTLWGVLRRAGKHSGIKKKVNPHSFRHARATHLAKDLTEQQLKAYLGWTASSNMAGIYVHLSGKDLDKTILKINGLATEDEPEDKVLKTIRCPRCRKIQDQKAAFCFKCGLPLTKKSSENIETEQTAISELVLQLQKADPAILNALINAVKK